MIVRRVEKHKIKRKSEYYELFEHFSINCNNLYNHANYVVKNKFKEEGVWTRYGELDKILKNDLEYNDYRTVGSTAVAQQCLRLLDKNWTSYFKALKDYKKHPDKYSGCPKMPSFRPKKDRNILIFTNVAARLTKDGYIRFPKAYEHFTIKPNFLEDKNFVSYQQTRVIPRYNSFVVELVYTINIPDETKPDNDKYMAIDVGLNNLATIVTNVGLKPVAINGKGIKSVNTRFNKEVGRIRSELKTVDKANYSLAAENLILRRNNKIDDVFHKASRYIVNYALEHDINTIIVGDAKGWKNTHEQSEHEQEQSIGTQIPFENFIHMIEYKAQTEGINVAVVDETYTSGTSFLDNEEPIAENYDNSRRVTRGLFVSNNGTEINADVNAAYQIMKKLVTSIDSSIVTEEMLHPTKINMVEYKVK